MKSLIIFFIITYVFTLENKEHHQKIVETVNNFKTTWKAQLNQRDYTSLINTLKSIPEIEYPEKITFKASNEDLPESYDLREAFSQCESVNEIKDDTQCPASWAYGAIETMNDRICIHSKGQLQTKLSLLYLITCCTKCGTGCTGGGFISSAFEFGKMMVFLVKVNMKNIWINSKIMLIHRLVIINIKMKINLMQKVFILLKANKI